MLRHTLHGVVATLCVLFGVSAVAGPVAVPADLEQWRAWVLQDEDYRQCPHLSSQMATKRDSFRCAWPERLVLTLDARGGTFAQRWQVLADTWVRLPGSIEHWPQDVRVDDSPGVVVAREDVPQLRMPRGSHAVSGRLSFGRRPELLQIDARTAMIDLTLDGRHIAQPERPDGGVWLGKRRNAEQPQRMEVQVYRLLRDEVPARLITTVRLQVSGEGREELLARVLPEGFIPLTLDSELPARLEPDGRLRVQVRAGSWEVTVAARGADVASRLERPSGEGLWAREEVWSFAGQERLRVAAAQGADGIDPAQAGVPSDWEEYPAFRMAPGSVLTIVERTRGLENTDENRLTLNRRLWLDFERGGLTAIDSIGGTMRRQWRLEMTAPFRLESARTGGETLLVTRNPDDKGTGLEVRTPDLTLITTSRAPHAHDSLPATGWRARFEHVIGELNLPPGHRLLAVTGADRAPDSWVESWGLWGVFGVLVVAIFAGWIAGWPVGAIALVGLLLMYQEGPPYVWLWGNVIAAVALARAAPEGRLRRYASRYRTLSFLVLGLALLPFLWGQVHIALYPQLEPGWLAGTSPPVQTELVEEPRAAATTAVPPAAAPANAPRIESKALESVTVTGATRNAQDALAPHETQIGQRYAAGTLLQTGPGIPKWRHQTYQFFWSGPVEADQTVRFLYIGPVLLGLWRIAGVVLLALLFVALLRPDADNVLGRWTRGRRPAGDSGTDRESGAAAAVAAWGFLLASTAASDVHAASTPDAATLEQLKARLTRPPECSPTCSEITSASVTVRDDQLDVQLLVSALTPVAVPMPSAGDRWQLDSVTLDGGSTLAVTREDDGTLLVPIASGVHKVRLSGRLAFARSIQLAFPAPPRRVSVATDGWDVAGVNDEQRLLSGSLELVRRRGPGGTSDAFGTSSEFPPFVRVMREFDFGLDWRVTTRVERIAPAKAALGVAVPLLAGESVLSEKLETHAAADGHRVALVGLERGQRSASWISGLARAEALELELPAVAARAEVWSFVVSPQWNVAFEGPPAVLPEKRSGQSWLYEFHPRPGEKLRLHITRPQAAEGATFAIDAVDQRVAFGKRSSDSSVRVDYRSTQGGRHALRLPDMARVTRVELDGQPVQLRPDRGELSLGLLPGSHSVLVEWTAPQGAGIRSRPLAVDLRTPASNVTTTINLPADRWPLFVLGSGVGPAVLYWGELVAFLAVAILLGRWPRSPLRMHEWLLLGLGLSSLSWGVLAFVGLWLFVMRWRESWTADVPRWRFNLVQVLLAVLTLCAVSTLVFVGVRQSLLASPDMGVAGPGSGGNTFSWFVDRTASELPRPVVVSMPLWVYRALMFAWALWIVLALLRWLRWTWQAWKTNGIWRGKVIAVPAV